MNKFFSDSLLSIVRQVLTMLISMLAIIVIARYLGPDGQGNYALIILLPNLLGTLLNFGVGVSAAYYIGKEKYPLKDIYKTNVILSNIFSLLSLLIAIFILFIFKEAFFEQIPISLLIIVLISVPFIFIRQFLLVIFQGLQDFKPYNAIMILGKLVNLIAILLLVLVFDLGLYGAIIAFILGEFTSVLIAQYQLSKKYSLSFRSGSMSKRYSKDVLIFGAKSHVSNILAFLNYRADIMIISYFLNPVALGLYTASINIVERLWVVSQAVSAVLFPKISSMTSTKNKNELTSAITRIMLFLSLLSGVVLYFCTEWIINLLFGEAYLEATLTFQLLIPGVVLGSVSKVLANYLAGCGRPELNMYASIVVVLLNVGLNIILIPIYGIEGAAISTTVSYVMNFLIKIVIFSMISKLSIHHFLFIKVSDLTKLKKLLRKNKTIEGM